MHAPRWAGTLTLVGTDGTVIDVDAAIPIAPQHILAVAFDVHGPTGTSLGDFYPGTAGPPQSLNYIADLESGYSAAVSLFFVEAGKDDLARAVIRVGGAAGSMQTAKYNASDTEVTVIATSS